MLVRAKFETKTIPTSPKLTELFLCSNCVYHKSEYMIPCSSFWFKLTDGKTITWTYKTYFSCDSKDVIYILICRNSNNFYLRQTQDFKQRTAKHKSDVKILHNSTCRICSEHLRNCNQAEPFFQIFLFYYETNTSLREYKEKGYILRLKPSLYSNVCIVIFINKLHNNLIYSLWKNLVELKSISETCCERSNISFLLFSHLY